MLAELAPAEKAPEELRNLVRTATSILGEVIQKELGEKQYLRIEGIRQRMASLRDGDDRKTFEILSEIYHELDRESPRVRLNIARAFTLMLELMNTSENAYRSFRLSQSESSPMSASRPRAIIYVLTAHPTEARSPENIAVFHLIQSELIALLEKQKVESVILARLRHFIEMAWKAPVVRARKPEVADEADHIYSTLLERKILDSLLEASHALVPVYVRSWVGGDKDGHPGVDETSMLKSFELSRGYLIRYAEEHLTEVIESLELIQAEKLCKRFHQAKRSLVSLKKPNTGDGAKLGVLRKQWAKIFLQYKAEVGSLHPSLHQLRRLLHVFPALVVPLELRESSDVLLSDTSKNSRLAIDRMLRLLAKLSRGGDPRWYARGFVVSMTSAFEHLKIANLKLARSLGKRKIPVIPLFEQAQALQNAPAIVQQWLDDPKMGKEIREEWEGYCEMMVGYSDSSKESGVLASRLAIAEAMHALDQLCEHNGVRAVFFQGSGGSVDRGGGSIQDQTAWWPHGALYTYKVTVQGEMVERSLATPQITRGQIERIAQSASAALSQRPRVPHLETIREYVNRVASAYRELTQNPEFLQMVEQGTPYAELGELHIGSRPTNRSKKQLSVQSLRAIPWVFCWTQTRVLLITWWGLGTAWRDSNSATRVALRKAFQEEPLFASYMRALGFTLAKTELPVWRIYLEQSNLDPKLVERWLTVFENELASTHEMFREVTRQRDPLWFKPWLGASIRLRSPMIHPLNLLQVLAVQNQDFSLFRLTATGISSGMLNTG